MNALTYVHSLKAAIELQTEAGSSEHITYEYLPTYLQELEDCIGEEVLLSNHLKGGGKSLSVVNISA